MGRAPDPDALLLDEPLSALDLSLRRQMKQELKSIQRSTGNAFVFVTHDQEEAMSMSDQIAVMNAGRIEQIGPPEKIYLRIEGQLSDRMYLGNRTHLSLRLANDEVIQIETRGKSAPDAEITGHCAPSGAVVLAETSDIP